MRLRIMLKGTNDKGEFVLKDMFDFPLVYTKTNGFDATTSRVLTNVFERLRKDEGDVVVIEKVRPTAVDNGDGTGSLKGELIGMGF